MESRSRTGAACRAAALLLLVLALCSYATANVEELSDCCLSTRTRRIPHHIVKDYSILTTAGGCPIPATVFITKRDLSLCAPPASESKWVAALIKRLQERENPKHKKGRKNKKNTRRAPKAISKSLA